MTTLSYGLNITKKLAPSKSIPTKRKAIFDEDDLDSEEIGNDEAHTIEEIGVIEDSTPHPQPESKKTSTNQKTKPSISVYGDLSSSHASSKRAKEATAIDPSVYDYDAAYDSLHATSAKKKAAQAADAAARKPRYMTNLLAAAEVRKRDQLRAKEKMLAKEREAEGDEFADKEKFVTGAYKAQQEEVRRLEEEERLREEEEQRRRKGKGMVGFYRSVLDLDEKRHEEAVAAAAQVTSTEIPNAEVEAEKTEADIAKELKARGRDVTINEEGQVVDKRELLSAGLNVAPKPRTATSTSGAQSANKGSAQGAYQGRTAAQRAMRERQTRMLEEQLEKATQQAAAEEVEKKRAAEMAAKSKKTEGDIMSAKERYLQRKEMQAKGKPNA